MLLYEANTGGSWELVADSTVSDTEQLMEAARTHIA